MAYDEETLNRAYDRTTGYCHICGKKLAWSNYGRPGARGAWEIEHSVPRAKGGTDHGNNLFPACISCNRSKQAVTTQTARRWHGRRCAPLSRKQREKARRDNAVAGGILGGVFGAIAGPWGVAFGIGVGATIGHKLNPDKK